MPMKRRPVLKGIGGTVAGLSLAGCMGYFTGDDTSPLWHEFTDSEERTFESHLETFTEETDHDLEASGVSNMQDQLETALPAGDGPMSFTWAHDWIGAQHEDETLYDASDSIDVDLEGTYSEAAANAVQWKDNVYGLPYAAETVTLMYNKDMVEEPPETIPEMIEIMESYDGDDQYGIGYPGDAYHFSAYLQGFGGVLYDEDADELGIDDDAVVEGLELVRDSIYEYSPNDLNKDPNLSVFQNGNAPFVVTGPWNLGGLRDAGIDVGVAPLPAPEGGEPTPFTGVQMWYFTSRLEDAEDDVHDAVLDWAEWYTTTEDVATTNAQDHAMIPVLDSVVGSDDLGSDVDAFSQSVGMGMSMPASEKMDAVWDPLESAIDVVLGSGGDAREELESAAEQIRGSWE
ncbi:extracellular solute-binding protein family 1 [Haloterrigena turkmenica DSM 5511]|uniref:Extracellular solute-binding protein family 1 n=2 Tax=Haloterrigena turkmenica TaxID=62320 RepID=D2RWM4_HALTV|nr:extracellular solute-binding protein family 1 [Haloterrigena turkmenica DSM 5511]